MAHLSVRLAAVLATLALTGPTVVMAQARERVAFVSVVDRKTGAPLDLVTPRDLVIREDGVAREVLKITPATGPMPVAVLIDNSAAAEPAVQDLRSAVTAFVAGLGGVGPVAILTMADRPTVVTEYTHAAATLAAGIGRLFSRPGSGVTTLDAVLETSRGLGKREGERAAIVVVSAGGAELSSVGYTRALDALKTSGATLHVVMLAPPGRRSLDDATRQRDTLFDRGVRATGGFRRDVLSSMSFAPALADLARALSQQFRVVYARPQTLIPPDSFAVAATAPGLIAYGTAARGQPK
ncbi:MAG: vWA domain-containing protein [Acidobacteriota bacterium]